MKSFFGVLSFLLSFGATIPYCFDIVRGRAKPARSTRILFFLLLLVTLIVQHDAFTSWVLLLTVGELSSQVVLFILSIKYGINGLAKLDLICYVGFVLSLAVYLITRNPALSLTALVLTDLVAFIPTIVKIWKDPTSDTWIFFIIGGSAAALASLLARNGNSYTEILFPLYIFVVNGIAAFPILIHERRTKLNKI